MNVNIRVISAEFKWDCRGKKERFIGLLSSPDSSYGLASFYLWIKQRGGWDFDASFTLLDLDYLHFFLRLRCESFMWFLLYFSIIQQVYNLMTSIFVLVAHSVYSNLLCPTNPVGTPIWSANLQSLTAINAINSLRLFSNYSVSHFTWRDEYFSRVFQLLADPVLNKLTS